MLLWCQQKCNVQEPLSFRFLYVAIVTDLIFIIKSIDDTWGRYSDIDTIPFSSYRIVMLMLQKILDWNWHTNILDFCKKYLWVRIVRFCSYNFLICVRILSFIKTESSIICFISITVIIK